MKKKLLMLTKTTTLILGLAIIFASCGPGITLTASWHNDKIPPAKFSKILVLSIGKSLEKRKLGENKIKEELQKNGFMAEAGLDIFPPDFSNGFDSVKIRLALLDKGFEGVLTLRVLSVEEQDRWVPGAGTYSYPLYIYRGFYRYYNVYGLYPGSAYMTSDVKVLLESNLYNVTFGELLWSGQSIAFSRDPTPQMAEQYAKNILKDILNKKVIAP